MQNGELPPPKIEKAKERDDIRWRRRRIQV